MPKITTGKFAPVWKVGRVKRTDSGGTLYNAIHVGTGREYWGVPSYDGEAIARRVALLNETKVRMGMARFKPVNPIRALESIFALYDGQEVDSDTHSLVMEILTDSGYVIRDCNEMEDDE